LTGIANRAGLEDYLQKALKSCRDEDNQIAFIFIDIDDFKTVNDTLGHGAGDRLLQSFVTRVSQSLPESAFLARISGDEFAIVLTEISGVVSVHNELQKLFQVLTQEFNHEHPPICITVSAGCAISNGRIEISELMRASDREMYRAKHAGKNRYYIVDLDTVSFED
jgi:diguanylate cyclase (GGDEF)-like protein